MGILLIYLFMSLIRWGITLRELPDTIFDLDWEDLGVQKIGYESLIE